MSADSPVTFEEAFGQLQSTVDRLEQGALPLDEALALYEQGMRLVASCSAFLDRTEVRLFEIDAALAEALDGSGSRAVPLDGFSLLPNRG
jgi:exodeoxyribonuclease VII small subunit